MNTDLFTQSFDDFATSVGFMDLALYAGAGLVLWILFKDKLSPVQQFVTRIINKTKDSTAVVANNLSLSTPTVSQEDVFFKLVESWKKTRDLAVQSNCVEAVKVADQMFPFLSPSVCFKVKGQTNE